MCHVQRFVEENLEHAPITVLGLATTAKSVGLVLCRAMFAVATQNIPYAATNPMRHVWGSVHGHMSMTVEIAAYHALRRVAVFHATNAALEICLALISVLGSVAKNVPKGTVRLVPSERTLGVDLLELKTYGEIDLDETPILVLGCGHFSMRKRSMDIWERPKSIFKTETASSREFEMPPLL